MGIYDRQYYQDDQSGFAPRAERSSLSMTVRLILLNSVIFLFGLFLEDKSLPVRWFGVSAETLTNPLTWYQFLTYGFIHSPINGQHLIWNMVGLWFFGRPVENRLGRREFLTFYLVTIVAGGVITCVRAYLMEESAPVIGASGATTAVFLLFAMYFPQAEVLLMFFLPVRAWVLGLVMVFMNFAGLLAANSTTAFDVHLVGVAMAIGYFFGHWNFTRLTQRFIPGRIPNPLSRRPKLRVLHPEKDAKDEKLAKEADRILEKLHREGIDSLTAKERKTLERYSKRVRK